MKLNEYVKKTDFTNFDNITTLEKIPVDIVIEEREKGEGEKSFTAWYFDYEEKEYRVPKTVMSQLKTQLEENPKLQYFKVKSKGSGINTEYTVVPLTE